MSSRLRSSADIAARIEACSSDRLDALIEQLIAQAETEHRAAEGLMSVIPPGADKEDLAELVRLWPTLDPLVHVRLLTIAQEDSAKRRPKPPTRH